VLRGTEMGNEFAYINSNGERCITTSIDVLLREKPKFIEILSIDEDYITSFKEMKSLEEVVISANIDTLNRMMFWGCSNLRSVELPSSIKYIGKGAFYDCKNLTKINLPDGLEKIGANVFSGCKNLSHIELPKTLKEIGQSAFEFCTSLEEIVIPDYVTTLESHTFAMCRNLRQVQLSKRLESIGSHAFLECNNLYSIDLPDTLMYMGVSAFSHCTKLDNVVIPDSVIKLEPYIFCKCENLKSVNLPKTLETIDSHAFLGCESLTNIELPNALREMGQSAFEECISLEEVVIPDGVTTLESYVFANCENLKSVQLPQTLETIGSHAFLGCESLTKIDLPKSLQEIGYSAFEFCTSLEEIVIPDGVSKLELSTFAKCTNLKRVHLPNTVKNLDNFVFFNCRSLEEIKLPDDLTILLDGTFSNCKNLKKIELPHSLEKIGRAFRSCESLEKLVIPSSVKDVDKSAFTCCDFDNVYLSKGGVVTLMKGSDENLEKTCFKHKFEQYDDNFFLGGNYKANLFKVIDYKEKGKVKFIPPDYTLDTFPNTLIDDYFFHNNNLRYGRLVKTLGFDTLNGFEKQNTLPDLMKIYFAIGGFSKNQKESEIAYDYILNHVAGQMKGKSPSDMAEEFHSRFSKLQIKDEYNPTFAKFFMKYYKDNPNFMRFKFCDDGYDEDEQDYLCASHNNFNVIMKAFPNRVVNGTDRRALLTPEFVALHSSFKEYDYVNEGNESLALLVGRYGYSQEQFEEIQTIYENAKKIKNDYVIMADKAEKQDCVMYRVLAKDDPLGFVLGDITNCCQHIGGAGESCVDDGYTNRNSGFLVFETRILDKNGNYTEEMRVLGQAYVWYDEKTQTVCYDNIEIPTKVLDDLASSKSTVKVDDFLGAMESSARAIVRAMNKSGTKVKRVTTGLGFNDLARYFNGKYKREDYPIAHGPAGVYSDANFAQYVIYEEPSQPKLDNERTPDIEM